MNKFEKFCITVFILTVLSIFFGGVLYCANQMKGLESISEICFWSSIILLLFMQINRGLSDTFSLWKKDEQ